jgi:hypothetical protein
LEGGCELILIKELWKIMALFLHSHPNVVPEAILLLGWVQLTGLEILCCYAALKGKRKRKKIKKKLKLKSAELEFFNENWSEGPPLTK